MKKNSRNSAPSSPARKPLEQSGIGDASVKIQNGSQRKTPSSGSNRASSLNVNAPAQSVSMGKMDAPSRTTLYTVDALNAACPGLNFFRRTANYANQSQIYQNHEQLRTYPRLHLRMVRSRTTTRRTSGASRLQPPTGKRLHLRSLRRVRMRMRKRGLEVETGASHANGVRTLSFNVKISAHRKTRYH